MTNNEARLVLALHNCLKLIDAMMPGVRYIALQDYRALNEVPLEARAAIRELGSNDG